MCGDIDCYIATLLHCNNVAISSSNYMKRKIIDKILILKTRSGDEKAFAKIYDAYFDAIYRFIYFKVNSEQAYDLTSETFFKVWQYIFKNNKIENLRAFLYQVARNSVIDYYRQDKSKKTIALDQVDEKSLIDHKLNPHSRLELAYDLKEIEQALKRIKESSREIIIMKYVSELSIKEIAEVLNKSRGAVRVMLHRAMKELRNQIEQPG